MTCVFAEYRVKTYGLLDAEEILHTSCPSALQIKHF